MVGFRSSLSLLTTLALSGSALGQLEDTGLVRQNATLQVSGTRFVVEFSDEASSRFRKRDGSADTEEFYEKIKENNVDAVPAQNFTSELFHGASFDLLSATSTTIEELEALPEVKKVWPINMVYAPKPESVGDGPEVSKWNPHVLTRVDRAHEAGFDGSDVIVAVIDSGIDYNHPALGGGFGPGFKVEGGYDLVGDKYDPETDWSATYPDEDPLDCLGHGTHVAGIIASGNKNLPGVAPNARLRAYKVFGCKDGVTEDIIAAAMLRAFEEGADIITASLGSDVGFPDNLVAAVISRITAQGTFVSAAAGNSGARGPFWTSNLANGHGSLTVGSIEHHQKPVYKVVAKSSSGESRDIYYVSDDLLPWNKDGTFKAHLPDVPRDWDICWASNIPQPAGGLRNDVLVVARGRGGVCSLTWQVMDSVMLQSRIRWAFIYNYPNISYETPGRSRYRDDQPIGFASINYEDGIWLEEQDDAGNTVDFTFVNTPGEALAIEAGASRMNEFSNWGTTLDGRMKPEISAPGGSILSTYLTNSGSWAVFSGTSMATPYIAGVAALFFNSVGGRSRLGGNPAEAAVTRIVSSGQGTQHSHFSVPAPVAHAGAGLVDAYKVVAFDTSISPATISLNDTMFFNARHTITVKNSGNTTVTYRIGHEAGSTARSRGNADAWISNDPEVRTDQGLASVKFSTEELAVEAGGSATFDVEFTEPSDVDPGVMAMYGGAIQVVGDNGDALKTTYLGIRGALFDADAWEVHRGVPVFFGQGDYGDVFEDGREFTLPGMPSLYFNVLWSTRELSFELVRPDWQPSDWEYPVVAGRNKVVGTTIWRNDWTGEYLPFPMTNVLRIAGVLWLSIRGDLVGGARIQPGEYRLLARALRTYGERENAEDWQFRLSPVFKLNAAV